MEQISLAFYNKEFLRDLQKVELPAEQKYFTATPLEALQSLANPNFHLIVILRGGACVGYFILHEKDGPAELGFPFGALLIRSLAVDFAEQGKGVASQAMRLLPLFVNDHFPEIHRLILLVNEKNIPARNLYQKVGFTEFVKRLDEVYGAQLIYCKEL